MQAEFFEDEQRVKAFCRTLSAARFARYLRDANGVVHDAVCLYDWNCVVSRSLYAILQVWEIALRNRLNLFLITKYGPDWPYNPKLDRQLSYEERQKLNSSKHHQSKRRGVNPVPTDPIVADLSVGFWSGLLAKSYEIPFGWRKSLVQVFPNDPLLARPTASSICVDLSDLRNRVAHHEPIYHLALEDRWDDLCKLTKALCNGSHAYGKLTCNFPEVWADRPLFLPPLP
jgi:hypothetical protein